MRRIAYGSDLKSTMPRNTEASWLDIAEIELNVLTRQCLNRRIATLAELQSEMEAWEKERNELKSKVHWQFRTADARTKLVSPYPALNK